MKRSATVRRNKQPSDYNRSSPDYYEHGKYTNLGDVPQRTRREQEQVEGLMECGFFWEEAVKLVQMHEHLYENTEVKQRLADDEYMQFARWLYEQKAINEGDAD
jgi:hypothetical protein